MLLGFEETDAQTGISLFSLSLYGDIYIQLSGPTKKKYTDGKESIEVNIRDQCLPFVRSPWGLVSHDPDLLL